MTVAKDPGRATELAEIIYTLLESIRICAHLFMPFMPTTSIEVVPYELLDELEINSLPMPVVRCTWGASFQGRLPVSKGDALFPSSLQAKNNRCPSTYRISDIVASPLIREPLKKRYRTFCPCH